ncbi:MAG: acyltransferase [Mycobacterium sp.]|nr:acyltransferase [Mycobacterium sp.]
MVAIERIHDWAGAPGEVVSWHPSPATVKKVADAPVSDVPVSYQQAQHLLGFRGHVANGTDMARLNIPAWDIPGRCDIRAMSHVINAYIRRHDTYHSWFELGEEPGQIIRRTVRSPKDIKFVPIEHGTMTSQEWQQHVLSTPDPWQWDCFNFGIIQRDDHFTFYVSVDHVHTDAMFMGMVLLEIHMMYAALVNGAAPIQLPEPGKYADYCLRQQEYVSALTLDSPEVRRWVDFARANNGTLPSFPLPLGDMSDNTGELLTVELMDKAQSDRFESACMDVGIRFSGGVVACAAIAERELTGIDTYHVVTPTTTRSTPTEYMTTGWFTNLVPLTVPISETSFADTARAAQSAFDSGMHLANVPFEKVVELGEPLGIRKPDPGVPMLSYLDVGLPPLSPSIIAEWEALNGRVFCDSRTAHQVGMWVNRKGRTTVTVAFPKNPVARASVVRYLDVMKNVYHRVAEGCYEPAPLATAARAGVKTA